MSEPDETVSDRARALVAAARALGVTSRIAREAARAAQERSHRLLVAMAVHGGPGNENAGRPGVGYDPLRNRRTNTRRSHERLEHPGRRQRDHRLAAADLRRILLVGTDEAWTLIARSAFEDVGYATYCATDHAQAFAYSKRLLPDVIVVQHPDRAQTASLIEHLSTEASTSDIPVVVLTGSSDPLDVNGTVDPGGADLLRHMGDVDVLVGEVDTLIAVAPRTRRALKRRLLDLQALARHYTPDAEGQAAMRHIIDRLQVAIFAVDEHGHCIAASRGATTLTGYSRGHLLTRSVFAPGFAGGTMSDERWRCFLEARQFSGTTTITNRAGQQVTVHAAAVAEIMPGLHVAAFAPA